MCSDTASHVLDRLPSTLHGANADLTTILHCMDCTTAAPLTLAFSFSASASFSCISSDTCTYHEQLWGHCTPLLMLRHLLVARRYSRQGSLSVPASNPLIVVEGFNCHIQATTVMGRWMLGSTDLLPGALNAHALQQRRGGAVLHHPRLRAQLARELCGASSTIDLAQPCCRSVRGVKGPAEQRWVQWHCH